MDISAVVLSKVIKERNLDAWSRLKLVFLDSAYSSIYAALARHYEKYHELPSFEELEVTIRDAGQTKKLLATIQLADTPEVSLDVALDALLDQYSQNEVIRLLSKYLDKLPIMSSEEVKEELSGIVMTLDEKTLTSETVYNMSGLSVFKTAEQVSAERTFLGINNTFDATLAGVAMEELILIGGKRGSGKSVVSANIAVSQYEGGAVVPYFTIEMTAKETVNRLVAILADVDCRRLGQGKLTDEEIDRVVLARAGMYEESDDLVKEFKAHRNQFKFEEDLIRKKRLKPDNQIIIIDDRNLTINAIDLHLGKLKAQFGDSLRVAVIDYLNQIVIDGAHNQYDWQPQIEVSKKLKNLARKYGIVMVSPYQIDSTGEARFGKGILDAADVAIVLDVPDKESNTIGFSTTKMRGGPEMAFNSGIDWDTLRMNPAEQEPPAPKEKSPKKGSKKVEPTGEPTHDLPWD